jgi:hypothetical protein
MRKSFEILLDSNKPSFDYSLKESYTVAQPNLLKLHRFTINDCVVDILFRRPSGGSFRKTFTYPFSHSDIKYIFNNNDTHHILQIEIKEVTGSAPHCSISFDLEPAPEIIPEHTVVIG